MATTFTWSISQLDRNLNGDGVTVAHWRCHATETVGDNTFTASSYGSTGHTPDPTAEDFIAYASLTEANVIGWVQAEVVRANVEASLQSVIDHDKTPTTATGVPW